MQQELQQKESKELLAQQPKEQQVRHSSLQEKDLLKAKWAQVHIIPSLSEFVLNQE